MSVEQAVLNRLPAGSRDTDMTLTTDKGDAIYLFAVPGDARVTRGQASAHAVSSPGGQQLTERFHSSLKEEEVWTAEYRSVDEARASFGRLIEEYNHDRPHRGFGNRTPHDAFLSLTRVLINEALTV